MPIAMTEQEYPWRAAGLRWGFIAGSAVVTLFAAIYFLNRDFILNRSLWLGSTIIYLFAMYRAQSPVSGEDLRAYIQPGFLAFVVANAMFYLYYYLLFTQFDPGLVDLQAAELSAAGEDPSKAQLPTFGNTFFTYIQSLIFGFGMAAIIGFFLRRRV